MSSRMWRRKKSRDKGRSGAPWVARRTSGRHHSRMHLLEAEVFEDFGTLFIDGDELVT